MTIIFFTVFAGKMCSAVSLLQEDFYANFGRDPITDHSPHDRIIWQVIYPNGASCGTVPDRTDQRATGVISLKLPHKQMHYPQGSFFKDSKGKTATKVIKNILPGHHKLKIGTQTKRRKTKRRKTKRRKTKRRKTKRRKGQNVERDKTSKIKKC